MTATDVLADNCAELGGVFTSVNGRTVCKLDERNIELGITEDVEEFTVEIDDVGFKIPVKGVRIRRM